MISILSIYSYDRFSRGGLQGLLTFQDLPVNSFIIWGGVSDIHLMYEERVDLRGC